MKICCFTGHRSLPPAVANALSHILDRHLAQMAEEGFTEFRTGGALGFDTLCALRVLSLREKHPECRLHLILPCPEQDKYWNAGQRALFREILSKADSVHYVRSAYTPDCMLARNRALLNGADACVAYLTHNSGGTLYTCKEALRKGIPFVNLADQI